MSIVRSTNKLNTDLEVAETKLTGIEAGATADQTKTDIDALGIDADTIDGIHASSLVLSETNLSHVFASVPDGTAYWAKVASWEHTAAYSHMHVALRISSRYDSSVISIETSTSDPVTSGYSVAINPSKNPNSRFALADKARVLADYSGSTTQCELWVEVLGWGGNNYVTIEATLPYNILDLTLSPDDSDISPTAPSGVSNTTSNLVMFGAGSELDADTVNSLTVQTAVPAGAVFTDTNSWRPVQNVLTSTSTTESLSAAQGKVLNDKISATEVVASGNLSGTSVSINVPAGSGPYRLVLTSSGDSTGYAGIIINSVTAISTYLNRDSHIARVGNSSQRGFLNAINGAARYITDSIISTTAAGTLIYSNSTSLLPGTDLKALEAVDKTRSTVTLAESITSLTSITIVSSGISSDDPDWSVDYGLLSVDYVLTRVA